MTERDEDYRTLINTKRWQDLRRWKLSRFPLCERCLEEGIFTPATEVHHVVPISDGLTFRDKERLAFDPGNLRALCHDCHVKTHKEIGRAGKSLTVRRNKRDFENICKKFFD